MLGNQDKVTFMHSEMIKVTNILMEIYINTVTDHVERKVPKYENHKLRERKVKTLTRN